MEVWPKSSPKSPLLKSVGRQQSSLKTLRHPHGHSYKSKSARNALPSNQPRRKPVQIRSLVVTSQTCALAFSVSSENQGSLQCSYIERLSTQVTPCWGFMSNGNKRYNNSVFPTNQQMPGCATTEKNWLLSQTQNSLKGIKFIHSKIQNILTEFLFNWQKS